MNLEAILAAMNTTYAIVKIMPKIVYTFISLSAVRVYNFHVFYSLLDMVFSFFTVSLFNKLEGA